jgi:hypothetical protein
VPGASLLNISCVCMNNAVMFLADCTRAIHSCDMETRCPDHVACQSTGYYSGPRRLLYSIDRLRLELRLLF